MRRNQLLGRVYAIPFSQVNEDVKEDVRQAIGDIARQSDPLASEGVLDGRDRETLVFYNENNNVVGAAVMHHVPHVSFILPVRDARVFAALADYAIARIEGYLQAKGALEYAVMVSDKLKASPWFRRVSERFSEDGQPAESATVFRRGL